MRVYFSSLCSLRNALSKIFWYLSPLIDSEFSPLKRDSVGGSHLTCPEKPSRVLQVTRPFAVRPSAVLALKREGLQRVRLSRVSLAETVVVCGSKKSSSWFRFPPPHSSADYHPNLLLQFQTFYLKRTNNVSFSTAHWSFSNKTPRTQKK